VLLLINVKCINHLEIYFLKFNILILNVARFVSFTIFPMLFT
jgi:hypothetical protein